MFIETKTIGKVMSLSFLSTLSILLLSSRLETPALANVDLTDMTVKQNQAKYSIAKDRDRGSDEDRDRDRGSDEDRDRDRGSDEDRDRDRGSDEYSLIKALDQIFSV